MKSQFIIRQLQNALANFTNLFTIEIDVISAMRQLDKIIVTTAIPHGLVNNQLVNIVNAVSKNPIVSLARTGKEVTAETQYQHDLVLGFNPSVLVEGAIPLEYNGIYPLSKVISSKRFAYTINTTPLTPAIGTPFLIEDRVMGINGRHKVTVIDTQTFSYNVSFNTPTNFQGNIKVRKNARISGAIDYEKAEQSYTKQGNNQLWAFVVLEDVTVSKDRNIDTDSTSLMASGTAYRQRTINPFSIYVFSPTINEVSGRAARDTMEDVAVFLYRSLLGFIFPSGLQAAQWSMATANGHGFYKFYDAYYVHKFEFQATCDITYGDTVGPDENVPFRDIQMVFRNDNEDEAIYMTGNVELDGE